jgi:type VII secretion integral membrane protein EccD
VTTYTRLSVAGSNRRADVVVSSDEPLGSILPRLLELLDETGGTVARPLTFVAPDGEQIDIARSPQQLDLLDGTLLRLERLDAAPPPPVVIDVTDAAADALASRPDRWGEGARRVAAASAIALAAAVGGLLAPWGSPTAAMIGMIVSVVVLLAVGAGLGLGRLTAIAALVAAAAAGLVLPLGIAVYTTLVAAAGLVLPPGTTVYTTLAAADAVAIALLAAVAAGITTAGIVVLVGIGVAQRRRGAIAGGTLGAVLGALLLILLLVGVTPSVSAAVTGIVAAFLTGLLPWVAMSAAGLTGLDQRVAGGERLPRNDALAAVDEAYAALTWSAAAVAVVLGVTGVALVIANELWAGLLALALALIAALRTRAFPLRAQHWLLWSATAVIGAAAVVVHLSGSWWGIGAVVAAIVLIAVAALVRPRPHTRARLRGLGNAIELLAVVALLPLLLGVMGVYAELLAMFGGGS